MSRPLLLIAASGLARETAVAARLAGLDVLGCLDDDEVLWGSEVSPDLRVLGGIDGVAEHLDADLVVCAGKGSVRERIIARMGGLGVTSSRFATVIDPRSMLADDTLVGRGSILLAGVVATAQVAVAEHVVCMPAVVLTHDDRVEPFATLCAGVVLGGNVTVGRAAYLGMAASVREGRTIGAGSTIGMGAAVISDVPEGETWAGVPARRLG